MEKTEIIKIIDQVNDYRFKRMRRDNIKWHLEKDLADGYMAIARDRKPLLDEAQKDLDDVEADTLALIQEMRHRQDLHPRDQQVKLICLYIDLLDMDPMKMEKHRQKINSLRPKVLGTVDEMEQIRQQKTLFD